MTTQSGVEIALRAHVRLQPATTPSGNTYFIPLNTATWNFDYSVNPALGDDPVVGLIATLTITNLATNASFGFNPALLGDNDTDPAAPGGYQNSQPSSFLNLVGVGYNPALNNTYRIDLSVAGVPDTQGPVTVSNFVQIGSGLAVPEPGTWAMMILGLGGVGAIMRRTRQTAATATA